jgi:hypothetical protein
MTIWVANPFAGFVVGWTWPDHVAAGYLGGTDYIFYPSDGDIVAAADGRITLEAGANGFTPGPAIILVLADGRSINYREVATPLVRNGQTVRRGDAIGIANRASRWPHIDATVGGKRVPFEPLVNVGTDPSGGGGTPVLIPQGDDNMMIYTASTASADGVIPKGGVFLQGDSGPLRVMSSYEKQAYDFWNANGIPYRLAAWTGDQVRGVTMVSGLLQWNADFTPTGKIIYADPAKAAFPPVGAVVGGTAVDLSPVLSALAQLATSLGADNTAIQAAVAAARAAILAAVPTAAQNGDAARAAIVAPAVS